MNNLNSKNFIFTLIFSLFYFSQNLTMEDPDYNSCMYKSNIGEILTINNNTIFNFRISVKIGGKFIYHVVKGEEQPSRIHNKGEKSDWILVNSKTSINVKREKYQNITLRIWIDSGNKSYEEYYKNPKKSMAILFDLQELAGLREITINTEVKSKIKYLVILKQYNFTNSPYCPICFEGYKNNDIVSIPKCGHEAHQSCINKHVTLSKPATCPICRANLNDLKQQPSNSQSKCLNCDCEITHLLTQ